MKVAVTHTRYTRVGGSEGYIVDLVKRLLDAGHEVDYFCNWWEADADARIRFHRVPNTWKLIRFMKVRAFDRAIERMVDPARFDVIHGFSKTSRQDVYTDGSGCLEDYQRYTLEDEDAGGRVARTLRRLSLHQKEVAAIERRRFTRGNFKKIIAMSKLAANQIRSRYGLDEREVEVVYNGVDCERFTPENVARWRDAGRDERGIARDAFVLLFVGNDYLRKGLRTLVDALAMVATKNVARTITACVVGRERSSRAAELARELKERGLERTVRLEGPQRGIERWFALADAFVLPSRFDIFGNVVLESMATGIPPIVSAAAGASECVEDGASGFVLGSPRDAEMLAARIVALATDEAKRREMGRRARDAALAYSWERHFARILAIYDEVARAKRAAAPARS